MAGSSCRRKTIRDIGPDVVRFLQLLLQKIAGKILVIWDGASIQKCKVIKAFLKKGGSKRIQIERLPGYAPELNPQEGVWNLREASSNLRMFVVLICNRFDRNSLTFLR